MSVNGHAAESRPALRSRGFLNPRVLAFVGLLVVTVLAANSCQQAQVRFTQDQAVTLARTQVDFQPTRTQVRLVRQGMPSRPFWAVSLSVPTGPERFDRLAVVEVDANKGKVVSVTAQPTSTPAP